MKRQKGAALIVVLSLLTMSLMLGLSGMQSSLVDERLAGNYRSATDAQMNAESIASELLAILNDSNNDKDVFVTNGDEFSGGFEWKAFHDFSVENDASCEYYVDRAACYIELDEDALGLSDGKYIFSMGAKESDGVLISESLPVFVSLDVQGIILDAEAAVTCVGATCEFFAKNPPTVIDGRDYKADVDTKGNISSSDLNPDGSDKAAYIVPEGDVELGNASVTGEKIESAEDYENYGGLNETWVDAEARVKSDIDRLIEMGQEGDPRVTYFGQDSGGEFSMPSSGIVVVDNVDLFMDVPGNFKFTGLIVVNHGSLNFRAKQGAGTVAVVGAVIAYNSTVNMENGNPAVLYSSEALSNVGATSPSGGGGFKVQQWF